MTGGLLCLLASVLCLAMITTTNAQLTQTVGWGSGGTHGKRASQLITKVVDEEMEDCNSEALLVDDILLMIQVSFLGIKGDTFVRYDNNAVI